MGSDFGLIMLLIVPSGVFAMSEMAVVSARKLTKHPTIPPAAFGLI